MTEPTSTEQPEEGQPVTTPEPTIEAMEAVEEAAVEAEATAVADVADDYEAEVGTAVEIPVVFSERPVQTVGRRKEAVVRVRLMPGTGKFTLNGKSLETYFPNKLHQQLINDPFKVLDLLGAYDVTVKVTGGGPSGQAGALRLAIARTLNEIDRENNRATLKKAGTQSLTATDTVSAAIVGTQTGILVNPAAASRLVLAAPASVKVKSQFNLTVTDVDAYGNVVTGFRGTLAFASSDLTADLPGSYTFTAADRGVRTFTRLMLKKRGRQTITATDTRNRSLTGGATIDVL